MIRITKQWTEFEDIYVLIKSVGAPDKGERRYHLCYLMYYEGILHNTNGKVITFMRFDLPGVDSNCFVEVISCTKSQIVLAPLSDDFDCSEMIGHMHLPTDAGAKGDAIEGDLNYVFCEMCRQMPFDRSLNINFFLNFVKNFDIIISFIDVENERVVVIGGRVIFVQMFMRG